MIANRFNENGLKPLSLLAILALAVGCGSMDEMAGDLDALAPTDDGTVAIGEMGEPSAGEWMGGDFDPNGGEPPNGETNISSDTQVPFFTINVEYFKMSISRRGEYVGQLRLVGLKGAVSTDIPVQGTAWLCFELQSDAIQERPVWEEGSFRETYVGKAGDTINVWGKTSDTCQASKFHHAAGRIFYVVPGASGV